MFFMALALSSNTGFEMKRWRWGKYADFQPYQFLASVLIHTGWTAQDSQPTQSWEEQRVQKMSLISTHLFKSECKHVQIKSQHL